jgi:hypothetical protein
MSNKRCSHCGAIGEFQTELTEQQQAAFLVGKLPEDLAVLVCQSCWAEFKRCSEDAKQFDWGGRITVMSLRKPRPLEEQPLDKLFTK